MHMFSRNVCLEMFHDRRFLSGQIELSLVVAFVWWAKESRWILLSCCWSFELLCFTNIQPTTLDGQLKNSCSLFCYSCYHLEHLSARVVSINISCRQIPPQLLTSLHIFSSSKKPSVLKFGCWVEYITVKNRCQNQDVCVFAGTLVPEKNTLPDQTAWLELITNKLSLGMLPHWCWDKSKTRITLFRLIGHTGLNCPAVKKNIKNTCSAPYWSFCTPTPNEWDRWGTDRPIPLLIVVSS